MIWWIIAAISAFFIKGLCGFANTLIFTSVLSFANNNINISPVELLIGYPSNAILTYKERKKVNPKVCIPIALLVILSSIPGIWLLKRVDATYVKIFFGVIIILIGIQMFITDLRKDKKKPSKVMLVFVGVLSGILCGMYGIGALLGAYMSRVTDDIHEFKANMSLVFFLENTFRIILYLATGIITWQVFVKALSVIPFMLIGLFLGIYSSKFLNNKLARKLVIVLLIISGAALIINNIV